MGERRSAAAAVAGRFHASPHLLGLAVAVLLTAGVAAFANLPRIEDPRLTNRFATILTAMPGASAERVEALVTKPIEDRLDEVAEIKRIESTSSAGISVVTVELLDAITVRTNEAAFSRVRDKLADAAAELPPGAGQPVFDDKRGAVAFSLIASVRWDGPGEPRLGILQRFADELSDRLRAIDGTELVRLYGETAEEITVTLDAAVAADMGLTVEAVAGALASADAKRPAGIVRGASRDLLVELDGELDSVARISAVPVARDGRGAVVRLDDVARVAKDWRDPPCRIALVEGERAVLVAARLMADARVDGWVERARRAVAVLDAEAGGGIAIEVVFDQSRYTSERLGSLGQNLLAGALVVMLVVLLGMGWRAALVVSAALPLSAAAALFGFSVLGHPIHQMTGFGLIIAVGLLIDNAIVVTDEVSRRVTAGAPRAGALAGAVAHLAGPLGASTLTTVLGFMPILLLAGNMGDFVSPISVSVILALVASYVLSLTVIAALAAHFVPAAVGSARWWRSGIHKPRAASVYRAALRIALRRPLTSVLLALVLPVAGFGLARGLEMQFFPPADRDQFEVELYLPAGASIGHTARAARALEAAMREDEGIERVQWVVGGSFPTVYYNLVMNVDDQGSYAHAIVTARDAGTAADLIASAQARLDRAFPEFQIVVRPFGQGPPFDAPVAFRLVGPGLEALREDGEALRRAMHETAGLTHSRASIAGGRPRLAFATDESAAHLAGLSLAEVAGQLRGALDGATGGSVLEGLEDLPVRVRLGDAGRGSVSRVASFPLVAGERGAWVPLAALGEVRIEPEAGAVTRRDGERVNNVLGWLVPGALPIEVTRAVLDRLAADGFSVRPGYRLEVAGDSEEQGRAVGNLMTYVPVLALLMAATLVLAFSSLRLALLVGLVAILSVGLGMLSLRLGGYPLGFNPIIGSAGLVGVAINGSIVVLAAIRADARARTGDVEAVVAAVSGSTRHIVSTALTTVGGFAPFLVLSGGAFWPPLAIAIAGGVALSTTLALLLTPAAYVLLERPARAPAPVGSGALTGEPARA